ncbi:hypothetical protein MX850_04710 [Erysipelothrix sp. Poltava]|nr:hypothetical protein MX850_04710 [Erysipelothrix sp. Poltava]
MDSAVRGLSKREVETEEPSNPDENITPPIVDPKPDTDSQKPETPDSNTEDSAQISPTDKTDVTLPKTGQACFWIYRTWYACIPMWFCDF